MALANLSGGRPRREYRIPVRGRLRSGSNTLSITIQPAIIEAERRAKASPYDVPSVVVRCVCSLGMACRVQSIVSSAHTALGAFRSSNRDQLKTERSMYVTGPRHDSKLQLAAQACL